MTQGFDDQGRHQVGQPSRYCTPTIAIGWDIGGIAAVQKITDALDRAKIIASAHLESTLFINLLQMYASQNMTAAKMFGEHGHYKTAISERRIMFGQAHTVGAKSAGFGHTRNDVAAGTHAKSEQIVWAMSNQRVIGRSQPLFQRCRPVLHAVD